MTAARNTAPARGADLHVHTSHSDGLLTPADVVRAAAAVRLQALAITDHDTLTALPLAAEEARRLGIELVPGVELSARDEDREVHILAYFIRPEDPGLQAWQTTMAQVRRARFVEMAERLRRAGYQVDADALLAARPRAMPGRRHLADWLVRTGQIADHRAAFRGPLAQDGPALVPKPLPCAGDAIRLVQQAGGVAALAHPPYDTSLVRLSRLAELGLGAVETRGPGVPRDRAERLRAWADVLGLVPVAGTDFHAPDWPGRWIGAIVTPGDDLERLRARSSRAAGPEPPPSPAAT